MNWIEEGVLEKEGIQVNAVCLKHAVRKTNKNLPTQKSVNKLLSGMETSSTAFVGQQFPSIFTAHVASATLYNVKAVTVYFQVLIVPFKFIEQTGFVKKENFV